MPAPAARSVVRGVSISSCSHIPNFEARPKVRTYHADICLKISHNRNMARRGKPKGPVNWFLVEWMDACGISGRGAQTKMMELTGWSKATMSQLYNGEQDYSPPLVNAAAMALNAEPYELLMHPEKAMNLRKLRESALRIAADNQAVENKSEEQPKPLKDGTNG